ncbi:tRNA (uridine(54)-C5)-methyltransferase TrmA [Aestuariibacter halophilus]|uniref:tRNA/tmRNA (uracil-C(5))-methyltransferase n=1 Tax=Fluctibacter halophilus TaxID=226011 RepID=A0ABS8GDC2_9ALTE|nr:tRNA (uridine(54)-C5)-methyltransferase TrmA [Aestuariibacter halophilus]MCC2618251.1 tRNA (uridine(54)-C5)-methyltransferase TrmA [Aestuariibacter halophilus]
MRPIDIDPNQYEHQLAEKVSWLSTAFDGVSMPEPEIFRSAPLHYRQRAEFRVWHEGDDLFHIMFDQATKEKYRVDQFPPASELINRVMQDLLALLRPNEHARRKLFQIDYLSTLSGEIVVSLLYHRPLDEQWQQAISGILAELRRDYRIDIIGRARKQKIIIDRDYVIEQLPVGDKTFTFKHIENSFTQPNAGVNQHMIGWALDVTRNIGGDLLELYCGLGNFSLPMGDNFDKVIATEIAKPSVAAAQYNIAANNIDNVTILQMSSEEFVDAQRGGSAVKKLKGVDLADYAISTVLVDPPRAGLDEDTCRMISDYANIVYISCSPETLARDLQSLTQTHDIERFALFDQFPYTHHTECGVFLRRR